MRGKLVKISRYGEAFWVRDVRELAPNIYVGTVDNKLMSSNLFKFGDDVPFAAVEIVEVADHKKPTLSVVT